MLLIFILIMDSDISQAGLVGVYGLEGTHNQFGYLSIFATLYWGRWDLLPK